MQDTVFQNAFEHAAIGMVLAGLDGRCLVANRAFCEMVGYAESELQAEGTAAISWINSTSRTARS